MAERRRAIRRWSRSEWQGVLARLEASGEEVDRFCQRGGGGAWQAQAVATSGVLTDLSWP